MVFKVSRYMFVALAFVAIVVPREFIFAQQEAKHCCNPAHPEPPPDPPGAATSCTWDEVDMKCENSGASCAGMQWDTAVPGKCCTPLIDTNNCNANNGLTNVTIHKYFRECSGTSAEACSCGFKVVTKVVDGIPHPVTEEKEVTQCSGSGCPSLPTCQ